MHKKTGSLKSASLGAEPYLRRMAHRTTWTSKLQPGKKAPDFKATLHDGSEIDSKDLHGKKVVLFFYPRDNSKTCTVEACNLRDHYKELTEAGYHLYGVSDDSERKHVNFRNKYDLPFPLISDKDNKLAKKYDVYGKKQFMGREFEAAHRTTFVIDEDWRIEKTIHPVVSSDHATQILA